MKCHGLWSPLLAGVSILAFTLDVKGEDEIIEEELLTSPGVVLMDLEKIVDEGGVVIDTGDGLAFVAEGAEILVVDVSDPELAIVENRFPADRKVADLQVIGNYMIVELEGDTLLLVDITVPTMPVKKTTWVAPDVVSKPVVMGPVVAMDGAKVTLAVGEDDGIEAGMSFAIFDGGLHSKKPRAIAEVIEVRKTECVLELPHGGAASVGDRGFVTKSGWKYKHYAAPDPTGGYFDFSMGISPVVGLGRQGGGTWGMMFDMRVLYRFRFPFEIGVVMQPVAFAINDTGKGGIAQFGAVLGYAGRYFGLSGGFGAHLPLTYGWEHFFWMNRVRLGNDEGFHVILDFNYIIPSARWDGTMVLPAFTVAHINVPVHPRFGIYAQFGGGNPALDSEQEAGWARFVAGLRMLVLGTSGSGSLWLNFGAGFGYVWDSTPLNRIDLEGGHTSGLVMQVGLQFKK